MCVFVVDMLVYGMVLTNVGTLAAMGRVAGHAGRASRSPRSLMAICSSQPANQDARHTSADLGNFLTIWITIHSPPFAVSLLQRLATSIFGKLLASSSSQLWTLSMPSGSLQTSISHQPQPGRIWPFILPLPANPTTRHIWKDPSWCQMHFKFLRFE
jgi:hypothetical protein